MTYTFTVNSLLMRKAKPIIMVLRMLIIFTFYLTAAFTLAFLIMDVYNIVDKSDRFSDSLNFSVMSFDGAGAPRHYAYSEDSSIRFQPSPGVFSVEAKPGSKLGYYALVVKVIHSAFVLGILWCFMKIFEELKLEKPFNKRIIGLLRLMALLFIVFDLFDLAHYLLTGVLLPMHGFKLQIQIGNGIITGMCIWVLSVVYEYGLVLQTENDLTV